MRKLFQALSSSGDAVLVIDERQKVIFWNQATCRTLGFEAEEVADRFCYEILRGYDDERRRVCQRDCRVAVKVQKADPVPDFDMYVQTADGERTWINVTTFSFPIGDTGPGRMTVHLFRDANEKKRNERFVDEVLEISKDLGEEPLLPPFASTSAESSRPLFEDLTPRESEVLLLLTNGFSTSGIAESLSISPSTARNHIQSILEKLGVHSRLEAVAYAYRHHLIEPLEGAEGSQGLDIPGP